MKTKTKHIHFNAAAETLRQIEELKKAWGETATDVIKRCIEKAYLTTTKKEINNDR